MCCRPRHVVSCVLLCSLLLNFSTVISGQQGMVEIARGTCRSSIQQYVAQCQTPQWSRGLNLTVRLVRQISRNSCIEGRTFGLASDKSSIWVTGLCEGEFAIMSSAINSLTRATVAPPTSPSLETINRAPTDLCGVTSSFRIIGGAAAGQCEYPWMVLVTNPFTNVSCGGAILDRTHVLTASHCFFSIDKNQRTGKTGKVKAKPADIVVLSGTSVMPSETLNIPGLQIRFVADIITHENFDKNTLVNDIAIIKLTAEIDYNRCHVPICLADLRKDVQQATNCRAMGWGISSNIPGSAGQAQLQWVNLPVVPDSVCKRQYNARASSATFCAGSVGKDTCQGDSGGPFVCQEPNGHFYAYGVVSAGLDGQCGTSVGLYTKVSSYLAWILKNTST
ncbi:unnamed protein product [Lymnaea stagnalis]|uniref:Peptidase S1 domain-containing protein n=1 Tax=Lymnaea stagnalis TaxID=6523 RepID=A0AAV2HQA1_LYMST